MGHSPCRRDENLHTLFLSIRVLKNRQRDSLYSKGRKPAHPVQIRVEPVCSGESADGLDSREETESSGREEFDFYLKIRLNCLPILPPRRLASFETRPPLRRASRLIWRPVRLVWADKVEVPRRVSRLIWRPVLLT